MGKTYKDSPFTKKVRRAVKNKQKNIKKSEEDRYVENDDWMEDYEV